jgi:hypothetical protein
MLDEDAGPEIRNAGGYSGVLKDARRDSTWDCSLREDSDRRKWSGSQWFSAHAWLRALLFLQFWLSAGKHSQPWPGVVAIRRPKK